MLHKSGIADTEYASWRIMSIPWTESHHLIPLIVQPTLSRWAIATGKRSMLSNLGIVGVLKGACPCCWLGAKIF